ncbi:hypothetical protein V2W45_1470126 [Cenococcum geophilum]
MDKLEVKRYNDNNKDKNAWARVEDDITSLEINSVVYENFRYNNNGATLSLIIDIYTSRVAFIYTIELKEAGGKAIEAKMQLAKIQELINIRRRTLINKKEVKKLVLLVASTSTRYSILLLLNLLKRVAPIIREILNRDEVWGWRHHFKEPDDNKI